MSEFSNRVDLQRKVLSILNEKKFQYELMGLSKHAIERWKLDNNILNNIIVDNLYQISSKLYFLANKSQEQITEDYKLLSSEVNSLIDNLQKNLT